MHDRLLGPLLIDDTIDNKDIV